jgi:uncharacterized RDD family membrane protein YckC
MSDSTGAPIGGAPENPPPPLPPPPSGWDLPEPVQPGPAPGYVFAGFWRRFGAFVIDQLILLIPTIIVLTPIFAALSGTEFEALRRPGSIAIDPVTGRLIGSPEVLAAFNALLRWLVVAVLLILAVQALYHVVLWSWLGGTLGQRILGMEVLRERDGTRIGLGRGCLRYLGYFVSGWVLYLGFIWVAFDARKQGWHDKIAGTVVVRRVS